MTIGKFIRGFRLGKGLSARKMADLIGCNAQRLSKWEHAKGSPREKDRELIQEFFGFAYENEISDKQLEAVLASPFDPNKGFLLKMGSTENPDVIQGFKKRIKELEDLNQLLKTALEMCLKSKGPAIGLSSFESS